jgi:hypothetical protein
MKNNFKALKTTCFMKYILPFLYLLLFYNSYSQTTMQATIKRGEGPMVVDIYLKPSATFSQKDEGMNLAIAIPATIAPTPSGASGTTLNGTGPVSGISGLQPDFLINNLGSVNRSVVVSTESINGAAHYIYTFVFANTAPLNHDWTANEEQLIFRISFAGCTLNCSSMGMKLVNLPNGGTTNQANWYFQPNTLGDITNYPSPFYSNPNTLSPVNDGSSDGSALSYIELNNILPVNFQAFNVLSNQCNVNLSWEVTQEANFAYYGVERSINAIDYIEAGRVNASNSNAAIKVYNFTDERSPAGRFFYRIRQVDKDGTFTYSIVKEVTLHCRGKYSVLIYPTLSKGNLHVILPPGFEGAEINIINAVGEKVAKDGSNGLNRSINIQKLTNGTYVVQVIHNNKISENVKVVLQK